MSTDTVAGPKDWSDGLSIQQVSGSAVRIEEFLIVSFFPGRRTSPCHVNGKAIEFGTHLVTNLPCSPASRRHLSASIPKSSSFVALCVCDVGTHNLRGATFTCSASGLVYRGKYVSVVQAGDGIVLELTPLSEGKEANKGVCGNR